MAKDTRYHRGGRLAAFIVLVFVSETPDGVSLSLTVTDNAGYGGTLFGFAIYGLPDGHANEAFDESALNFSAAANANTNVSFAFVRQSANTSVYTKSWLRLDFGAKQTVNSPAS